MRYLLDDQEVLHFGLDDFNKDTYGHVCVQAKDLKMYIIDYAKRDVIYKLDKEFYSFIGKSIFYNPILKDNTLKYF